MTLHYILTEPQHLALTTGDLTDRVRALLAINEAAWGRACAQDADEVCLYGPDETLLSDTVLAP